MGQQINERVPMKATVTIMPNSLACGTGVPFTAPNFFWVYPQAKDGGTQPKAQNDILRNSHAATHTLPSLCNGPVHYELLFLKGPRNKLKSGRSKSEECTMQYRGGVVYFDKGSVHVVFKFALQRGESEGRANFKTKHTEPLK